jgi:hypothetical protein
LEQSSRARRHFGDSKVQTYQIEIVENRLIDQLDHGVSQVQRANEIIAIRLADAARQRALLKFYRRRARAGLAGSGVAK